MVFDWAKHRKWCGLYYGACYMGGKHKVRPDSAGKCVICGKPVAHAAVNMSNASRDVSAGSR